jgi:23S rRNA (cytidine1920-2'-O)/16S rRNA (cytidine1409-2'-O)-methyltransferase
MPSRKIRLDLILVKKGIVQSRDRAQAMIMSGKVTVNGRIINKAGTLVLPEDDIVLKEKDHPYVSRGGLKLEKVLEILDVDIGGFVCLDVGASTGGFTDCLLQHGVGRVYAVDVGYGQLAWKLRQNPRVVVIERKNIRHLAFEAISQLVDLVTVDVSFISLKKVVPEILKFMKKDARILALIKPQFEVGKRNVGKKGVVRDPALHAEVIENLIDFFAKIQLIHEFVVPSSVLGPKGNREFFISLKFES